MQKMDPQMRKLLEVSWEAWMDSGIDVNQLRGSSRVGVYIGCCGSEVPSSLKFAWHVGVWNHGSGQQSQVMIPHILCSELFCWNLDATEIKSDKHWNDAQ